MYSIYVVVVGRRMKRFVEVRVIYVISILVGGIVEIQKLLLPWHKYRAKVSFLRARSALSYPRG